MTSALRILIPVFLAILFTSPAAGARRLHARAKEQKVEEKQPDRGECLELAARNDVFTGSLPDRTITAVRITGSSMADDALWDLAGGPPSLPLSPDETVALVSRLAQTGLYARIDAKVTATDETTELELLLTENPRITAVRVRGLSEFRTEDVLDRLLEAPDRRAIERRWQKLHDTHSRDCPAPLPPRLWVARVDDNEVRPGILWRGLKPSLDRVLRYLRSRGYPLARLEGELSPAGELLIVIDEGRLGAIALRGVDSHIARDVETELGIRTGDVFSTAELASGLERVQKRWPFLRADRRLRKSSDPAKLQIEPGLGGGFVFRTEPPSERPPPPDDEDDDRDRAAEDLVDDLLKDIDDPPHMRIKKYLRRRETRGAWYAVEGDTLVVSLRSDHSSGSAQWIELVRHTPVTGFAPGLAGTLTIWDPSDRTHLLLDAAVSINTKRHSSDVENGSYLERLNAQEKVDWLAGPRLRMPGLAIAELGGQIHTLTDTPDRWRISAIDSYVYSALINRADREYYRRSGYAAFITLHLAEMLTLGAEYRYDRYAPLAIPSGLWTVWNRDDPLYGGMAIDQGEMGSMLFRMEYRSEKVPLHHVGSMWRNSETSLVDVPRNPDDYLPPLGLRTINTIEVADKSLGGSFKFTKIVSDTFLTMETGRHSTLMLRVRGAGGRDLPLQKQEGLGGWTALRGYDFKEFRGTSSLLGTVQLEGHHFGAFFDVGSVRQSTGWMDPRPSAGALFTFANGSTRAEAAWRLDGKAKPAPDFRILFAVPL